MNLLTSHISDLAVGTMYTKHSGGCVLALLLALIPSPSNSFLSSGSLASTVVQRLQQQTEARNRPFMKANKHDATLSSAASAPSVSRKSFIGSGALATMWSFAAVATTPFASDAAQFAGVEIRGIDVAEVLHPGVGGTGKATKPLRDCLLNVERVRISTKQVKSSLSY